jgi:hypothetical protein
MLLWTTNGNHLLTFIRSAGKDSGVALRSAQFRMADKLAGGQLEALMGALYGETGSWEEVSRRLYAEHTITISGQTLRRWAELLGIGAAA